MKIEFTEDFNTVKKGTKCDCSTFRANQLIELGVAKEYKPKRKKKPENAEYKTK